ncbi:hypothetical protein COW36_06110 [bacterium (Candidatus Blackallbacteria) CG17_big_fil_post_rev_8_21_14_2_50_48_46]|uniref:Uncharacterized protein n=1 Tax=bacterium (Candidatus Blackallbacteria) CG17_big_fil_post_rev_8_21_14_2_50_48_46 TaxID=2014261 RepID=A0A2M7G7P3_9BACT|nr:MAG: hypothetical protein COW64_16940 [bacterium (Candidatus Blackallbacteria) CG18_big_fil_WC_8_21_14_2_50_49_26]PIW18101.1 MAG: hypothetical protein COW36_06110 [bacterium (Candidatus Blackallbacteria) CG17_big_fil_post_rev_8_21_14_2_50_48_46]PIW51110.1 MAG: hypothetical protein COW20_00260 [bacterium (Candidatus Blackallbacteria) CG13_big_fil_rev_8_21_14_2_50_49_14]
MKHQLWKTSLCTAVILALFAPGIPAFSADEDLDLDDLNLELPEEGSSQAPASKPQAPKSSPQPAKPASMPLKRTESAAPSKAEVLAQVLQVNVRLTEQNITEVEVSGIVKNISPLAVRGVQLEIELLDPEQKPVRRFSIEPYAQMVAGSSEHFSAAYTLREYPHPYLSARVSAKHDSTSYLQIADWIMANNQTLLLLWNVPVKQEVLDNERSRVDLALQYLRYVRPGQPYYAEAQRKWNLIELNYGKRLVASHSLHEALLTLANINPTSEYAQEAQALFNQTRVRTIFERAMEKAVNGNLRGAYRQMQYIPADSNYAREAQAKQEEWKQELDENKIKLGPVNPPAHLSSDQRSVWLRRQHGPEGVTTSKRDDGSTTTTWWYLDYSHFSFDEKGKLLSSTVY